MTWFTKYVIGERDSWGRKVLGGYLRLLLYLTPIGWLCLILMWFYEYAKHLGPRTRWYWLG